MIVSAALIAAGAGCTLWLARTIGVGRMATAILLASFGLRAMLAITLYVISAWHLPIFPELHMTDGFWRFTRDAQWYHWLGIEVAEAFRWGTELPEFQQFGGADFFILVGWLYRTIGAHPVYVPLVNATIWTGIACFVYILVRRLNGERAALIGLTLAAAWPSSYVWSAQILKDSLVLLLTLSVLWILILLLERRGSPATVVRLWLGLISLGFLLTRLRWYPILLLIVAVGAVVCLRLVVPTNRSRLRVAGLGVFLLATLVTAFIGARAVSPEKVFAPRRPDVGHARKAEYLRARGNSAGAELELRRARAQAPALPAAPSFSVRRGVEQLLLAMNPATIGTVQTGFEITFRSGSSPGNIEVPRVVRTQDAIIQGPGAISRALWMPFPWQWFAPAGDSGAFRRMAVVEVILIGLLTPWMALGVFRALRTLREGAWLLVIFSMAMAAIMGLTLTNLGALFRMRLQFLIPLVVVIAAYGASESRLVARLLPQSPDR